VNSMLQVKNLSKVYEGPGEEIAVLSDLQLEVAKGESVAIVGPSGSGKTTLLNLLGTLDTPTSGSIEIDGEDVGAMTGEARTRFRNRSLGFVFQQHFLLPQCTALENVLMPRLAGDWDEAEDETRTRALALLEELGLKDRIDHMPYQLSGGERLRVAVARALINQPALVLADEPTGSLDPTLADKVADLFVELNEARGATFLTVTHNLPLAERIGTVYSLEAGKLVRSS